MGFPVDDITLAHLEHALDTSLDENFEPVGGEFTLLRLLEFLSGYDETMNVNNEDVWEIPITMYSKDDVIRALIAEIRRLRY